MQSVRALVVSCLRSSRAGISVLSGLHRRRSRAATASFKRRPGAHTETQELAVYCNAAFVCSRIGCGLQRSNFESDRAFRDLRQLLSNGGSDSGNALLYSWRDRLAFSAVDACRTAQLMRAELSPDAEDDVIARGFTAIHLLGERRDHHRDSLPVAHIAGSHAADQGTVAGSVGRAWRLHVV